MLVLRQRGDPYLSLVKEADGFPAAGPVIGAVAFLPLT